MPRPRHLSGVLPRPRHLSGIPSCIRHLSGALLLLTVCCTGTSSSSRHSFRISEEDGVRIAVTRGGPRYQEPLFRFEVELTLQEDPDRPESMLFRPGTIQRGDDGCFYVLDGGDCRIVVFDTDGRYLRSFGRKGDGPGEFRSLNLLRFTGDVMTIFDFSLRRTTCIRTDGTLLDTYRAPGAGSPSGSVERLDDGGFVLFPMADYEDEPDDPVIDYSAERIVVTAAAGDTLCDLQTPFVPWGYEYRTGSSSGAHRMEFVGSPELFFVPGRGILMSTGVEPELSWFNTSGEVIERIVLDLEPEPVTAQEREQIRLRAQEDYERSREQRPDHAKAVLDALQIPEVKAFWEGVIVDDAGFYWLRVPELYSADQPWPGSLFLVLSPEGEYLGHTRRPIGYGTFRNGRFMGIVSDEETGAAVPTIYRIVPAVEGLKYPD